jgi:hypothetical protein
MLIFTSSCVSTSSFQNGKTLGKNKKEISGNFTYGKIDLVDTLSLFDLIDDRFYLAEFSFQSGLKENIDIYGKFNTSLYFTGGLKYQYSGNQNSLFANSIGIEAGLGGFFLFGSFTFHSRVISYNSIHIKDNFSFYFNPQYTYFNDGRYGYGSVDDVNIFHNNFFGFNSGILIGRKNKIGIELSQLTNNKLMGNSFIITIGYKFNLR